MLPEFDLLRPQSLAEALQMLAEHAPDIVPLAGGTNVIVGLRDGRPYPPRLMDVSRLAELRGVRREDGHVVIGGGTRIADLLREPLIGQYGAPLREAAAVLGNPLIRNRATVAGNLVDASPAADTAPALLALNAEVELASVDGTRRLPLDGFTVGVNETVLRPDELLLAIRWPLSPAHSVAGFHKLGLRKAAACAVVNMAVMVECAADGRCQQARIALGAVAPRPLRCYAAEESLSGQLLAPEVIAAASRLAAGAASPIDDVRGTGVYRRRMVDVLVRRLLTRLAVEIAG